MGKILGKIISGTYDEIILRKKTSEDIELGELMIAENNNKKILLQAYNTSYGSQFSSQKIEFMAGMKIEQNVDLDITTPNIQNYSLVSLKPLILIQQEKITPCKTLPNFFEDVRAIEQQDLDFLSQTTNPLFLGNLRSGSKEIDLPIKLDGEKVLSHHILITAQTGRGKSNLVSCMLWDIMNQNYAGVLVLDPHDEYYGRKGKGLKDHQSKKVTYYTTNLIPGALSLKINIKNLKPQHFKGVFNWSEAQNEALYHYYNKYKQDWIEGIIKEQPQEKGQVHESTLNVLKRRMFAVLGIREANGILLPGEVFEIDTGESTINDIINELEKKKIVIIDTSKFTGPTEILIGSILSTEIFNKYRNSATNENFSEKPVISILLEEALRVIGKDVLERGNNIFSTIAKEGRKFKISLTGITQLPSLIPKTILANMSTKIILGMEMAKEREAIIDSSAQDLTKENKAIASLDKGEAIVTSTFSTFAIPLKIPLFENFTNTKETEQYEQKLE